MTVMTMPEVGQQAPDFRLRGPGGQFVTLAEHRGRKNVVLVFFPLAFSPVCSHQLPEVQVHLARYAALDAAVYGVSVDSYYTNEAFAKKLGLGFPLLSDLHREASRAYGVFLPERAYSARVTFVVDKQGRIAHRDAAESAGDLAEIPSNERALAALQRLQ